MNALQKRIRLGLKRAGKNQEWLAAQLGISKSHLSMLLARKRTPSLALAVHLAELTKVPVAEFVSDAREQAVS